ncbi:right-handed parallel beta-helix repeat-containing protein [Clostridium saccharoperbutylacetonicum]|uniref:right-handed parallel beta-helix repeat-containing protein n=1 Tax=Clostridium saccharoperbutylacetonicum TaxID=36745 RepID=UPI0039EB7A2E
MSQWLIFDEVHATVGDSSWERINKTVLKGVSLNTYINNEIGYGVKQFYIEDDMTPYELNGSIDIDKPEIKIYGQSKSGTRLHQNSNVNTIMISKNDFEISNLYIDGSGIDGRQVIHAQSPAPNDVDNVNINNCIIYGNDKEVAIGFYGISTDMGTGNVIKDNEINSPVFSSTPHEAIVFYWQQGGSITGNTIDGTDLYVYQCNNIELSNNTIENTNGKPGIQVDLLGDNININHNDIKNAGTSGISIINTTTSGKYSGIDVTDNTIYNTHDLGIEVNNISGGNISNNTVTKTNDIGINILKSDNLVIDSNTIYDSQKGGIRLGLAGNNVKVSNNRTTKIHDSGIAVVADSTDTNSYTGVEVLNNIVTDTYYFGIAVNNLDGGIIKGNSISETDYYGIYLLKSKNLTVENNSILDSELERGLGESWTSSAKSSIYLDYSVSNSNISNNYLKNTNSTFPNGILIASTSTDNTVSGNVILGNFSQAVVTEVTNPTATTISYVKPPNLKATATDNSITLNWNPITTTGASAIVIEDYEILIDGDPTNSSAVWSTVHGTTYLHNGLNKSETHNYYVRMNKFGDYSTITQTTDSYLAPILTVGDYTEDSIEIRWNAETGQNYEVQVNGNTTTTVVGAINFYKKLGLSSDTTYKFKVRIVGQNQWSNEVTQKTKALIPVIVVPPTTPPAVITTPPAVITTPPAVVTTPSAATTKRKKKHKAFVEITVDEYKKILYKENLIYDYEEKKLKRVIEYSFKYQSHYYLKKIKDGKVIEAEEFKVDLVPEDLFSEQEMRNALIGKNDNIDTIMVRDFSNPPNTNEKNDLSQYSEEKESILTIKNNNTEVETIETYRKDIKNLER